MDMDMDTDTDRLDDRIESGHDVDPAMQSRKLTLTPDTYGMMPQLKPGGGLFFNPAR